MLTLPAFLTLLTTDREVLFMDPLVPTRVCMFSDVWFSDLPGKITGM